MSPSIYDLGIDKLSPADRLRLIGEICDTLDPADPDDIPDHHRPIIAARLADIEANPDDGLSLEETMALLRARQ